MRTNWKALKGKDVIIRYIIRLKWIKTYGDLQEVRVLDVSPSGVCIKVLCCRYLDSPDLARLAEWSHRDAVKLVEVLE